MEMLRFPRRNTLYDAFELKLAQDVALRGANGAPNADLPAPQGHAHEQ